MKIAIVGDGPRALAALEALAGDASAGKLREVALFSGSRAPGAGPNFDPAQCPSNLLNIPMRDIGLAGTAAALGGFPSFDEWVRHEGPAIAADDYPSRARMGRYLTERLATLRSVGPGSFEISICDGQVTRLGREGGGWTITSEGRNAGPFAAVLLTLGHLPVLPGEQIARWRRHAAGSAGVLLDAYPTERILGETDDWSTLKVGIRGLGLSMIDVVRALTIGLGGSFEPMGAGRLRYLPGGGEPLALLPFSLDGLPLAPKPATAADDAPYTPSAGERRDFGKAVRDALETGDGALQPLLGWIASATASRMQLLGAEAAERRARQWLERQRRGEESLDDNMDGGSDPVALLGAYLDMARCERPPSPGYVAGQLWRHFQPELRTAFDGRDAAPDAARALIDFDERMKRFSFGPPAEAGAQLLALVDRGILSLRQVADPDIATVPRGWMLSDDNEEDLVDVMVDSVLSPPTAERLDEPLVPDLLARGLLSPSQQGPGLHVDADLQAIGGDGAPVPGLAVAGRLASGALIATDSLHACFGDWAARWAAQALSRG